MVALISRRDALRYLAASAALDVLGAQVIIAEPVHSGGRTSKPGHAPASARVVHIPFEHYGRRGNVAVTYGVTDDPRASGFDALPGMSFDLSQCRGYPTTHGVIDSFEGTGYRTLCGWIQIVTGVRTASGKPTDKDVSVDTLPALGGIPMPFASMGNLPQMFDAPCRNLGEYDSLHWTADTFLTTLPIRSRDEEIHRLLGFRWGYTEHADPAHHPTVPLPLAVTTAQEWNALLPTLRKDYPGWRFASAT
jgi:hypothetical protein